MARQFRLIDLIVVVACVGLMLAGVSSSLLSSRKIGCRPSCQGNARQVVLALIQYLNTNEHFPPSQLSQTGTSGFMFALPYLEGQDLYNAYNFDLPRWDSANSAIVSQSLSIMYCPLNPHRTPVPASNVTRLSGSRDPGLSTYANAHYAVNWGGGRAGWGRDFEKTEGRNRGLMRAVADIKMTGPLPLIGSNDLTDGASTTVLVAEKRGSQGWAVGGWAGSEFDVGTSPAMNTGDKWGDMVYSGSYHPGWVSVAACDGSVHIVSSGMDRKVWYALITRDGGEPLGDNEGAYYSGSNQP